MPAVFKEGERSWCRVSRLLFVVSRVLATSDHPPPLRVMSQKVSMAAEAPLGVTVYNPSLFSPPSYSSRQSACTGGGKAGGGEAGGGDAGGGDAGDREAIIEPPSPPVEPDPPDTCFSRAMSRARMSIPFTTSGAPSGQLMLRPAVEEGLEIVQ